MLPMRRRLTYMHYPKYDDKPGDVMLYNYTTGMAAITSPEDSYSKTLQGYVPYGIVVVPSSHNVYGDGTMGVLCLINTGYMPFGPYERDSVFDYLQFEYDYSNEGLKTPILDNVGPLPTDKENANYCPIEFTRRIIVNVFAASDFFTDGSDSCNPSFKYNPHPNKNYKDAIVPNIYNIDGTMNPLCVQTSGNRFLFDYNGFENTKRIYDAYGNGWNNRYNDNNSYNESVDVQPGEYPIIERAVNFDIKGRWYLPGSGEMLYIISMYNRIQNTLKLIQSYEPYCELILDAYYDSTIASNKFKKAGETDDKERNRCHGFWFDCSTSNPSIPEKYYMSSFGTEKKQNTTWSFHVSVLLCYRIQKHLRLTCFQ